jgi:hypothetical protein
MRVTACLALALAFTLTFPAARAHAAAAPSHWLVKGQDIGPWDNAGVTSQGLAAQAAADGVSLPAVTWELCGNAGGVQYGLSDITVCQPGMTLVTESYTALKHAITSGALHGAGVTTAIVDLESWAYTPADEQANVPSTITSTARLAAANGIRLIVSTGGTFAKCAACWATAAKAGAYAYMVAAQTQGGTSLPGWEAAASFAASTIRTARSAAGTGTLVMLGLATNTPVVHPASLLFAEWSYGTGVLGVGNYWLNANNWGAANVCTAAEGGPGCPQIAISFWQQAGALS